MVTEKCTENNVETQNVETQNAGKRRRGRPKKTDPPVVKIPKGPIGRPKIYDKGYAERTYKNTLIPKERYSRLMEIEEKYNKILNALADPENI